MRTSCVILCVGAVLFSPALALAAAVVLAYVLWCAAIALAYRAVWWYLFVLTDPFYGMEDETPADVTAEQAPAVLTLPDVLPTVDDAAPPAFGAAVMTTVDDYRTHSLDVSEGAAVMVWPIPQQQQPAAAMEVTTAANAPVPLYRVRRRIARDEYQRGTGWVLEADGVSEEDAAALGEFWEERGWHVDVSALRSRRK